MDFSMIAAVASSLVAVTVVLNTYILNKIKPTSKLVKGLLAFGGSTLITLAVKFIPPGAIVALIGAIAGVEVDPIDLASGAETLDWLGFAGVDVFLFIMSGGVWDLSKIFGWRESTKISATTVRASLREHFRE